MSNTYRINFKQLRQENLKDNFEAFERAFAITGIDVYLIGALARDTWFAEKGIRALGTKDIDFAVLIPDQQKFDALKIYLVEQEKFTKTSNEYTLRDTKGYEVDLFPFGEINIEGKKIKDQQGYIHTNVSGFKEVYEEATEEVVFDGKYHFRVASLAGIVILKLIAWDDRPEMRSDDIRDIASIIRHYFELEETLIFEHHADLFKREWNDLKMLSARILGREMAIVLKRNELLKHRVTAILNTNEASLVHTLSVLLFSDENPEPLLYQADIIKQMLAGIEEQM